MSFDSLFGSGDNNNKRPDRFSDIPTRPEPSPPNLQAAEPWFVTPEPDHTKVAGGSKRVVKRIVSIIFPIAGLAVLISIIAFVVKYVLGIYE